jgi:hypothetical protein
MLAAGKANVNAWPIPKEGLFPSRPDISPKPREQARQSSGIVSDAQPMIVRN